MSTKSIEQFCIKINGKRAQKFSLPHVIRADGCERGHSSSENFDQANKCKGEFRTGKDFVD